MVKKIYDIALSNMIKASVYTGEFKDNSVEQKVTFCICTEKTSNMKLLILYCSMVGIKTKFGMLLIISVVHTPFPENDLLYCVSSDSSGVV